MPIPRFFGDQIDFANSVNLSVGVSAGIIPVTGVANAHVAANAAVAGSKLAANARLNIARSKVFNIDAGAANFDDVIIRPSTAITITAARVVYTTETSGVVAAANVKIGTAVNGAQVVAQTALGNGKNIGEITALNIVSGAVAANLPVCVRMAGLANGTDGEFYVEIEYTVDD
jgi:peptidoglycan hydrolase-like protein with peptidoglycan-binding domain